MNFIQPFFITGQVCLEYVEIGIHVFDHDYNLL